MSGEDLQKSYDGRIDHRYNVASYLKYLEDLETKQLDKLCMTEIVNADLSIAMVGEEEYIKGCREVLQSVEVALAQLGLDSAIFVYSYNYKNFVLAANEGISAEAFTNLMQGFYDQFELATASNNNLSAVSRFVLVFGKEEMLNRAVSAHYLNRNSQINFFVATDERAKMRQEFEDKMKIFDLVNYAIKNDTITPFYQGMRDNKLNKITKYEALMRLYDEKGKLHSPASFLESSKELKLYPKISKIMLDKAISDFENKTSELSINISSYDIQLEDFRIWFLERLKKHPKPENITIEFVETENYNLNDMLKTFIADIKTVGCKIAIDDFGVGFATYTSLISLKPDIIKVDGDIIKNLTKNEENRIILNSICYMTKLINSKTVAEFVEDSETQVIVDENNIDFSQGYLFSKPLPITELEID